MPASSRPGSRRRSARSWTPSPTPARPPRSWCSRHRLEAAWRWEQEDLAGLAAGLGNVALWDDWRHWQGRDHRSAPAVEPDDIRRVASIYLAEPGLTVGWSLPRPARDITVLLPGDLGPNGSSSRPPAPPALAPDRPIGLRSAAGSRSWRSIGRGGRSWPMVSNS